MAFQFEKFFVALGRWLKQGDQESTGYQSEILVTTKYRK